MGRIIKKKDPVKKKEQRLARASEENSVVQEESAAAISKASPAVKKSIPLIKPKAAGQEPNFVEKSVQFLREVKIELKKVTWPSRKQAMGSTVVVIILVMVISAFLGIVDFGLSSLVRVVLP